MMNKHFVFTNDSMYVGNGCSCCEPDYMEVYNSDETDGTLGSAHSEEECYVQAIMTVLGRENINDEIEEGLRILENDFNALLRITERMGITVEIVE